MNPEATVTITEDDVMYALDLALRDRDDTTHPLMLHSRIFERLTGKPSVYRQLMDMDTSNVQRATSDLWLADPEAA